MLRALSNFYSPEDLQVFDLALEGAWAHIVPECLTTDVHQAIRLRLAAALMRVAENGSTDVEEMQKQALAVMHRIKPHLRTAMVDEAHYRTWSSMTGG